MSAFLGIYVLGQNPRRYVNRSFFALMMAFSWWDACEAIERAIPAGAAPSAVYPWAQGVWLGISAVPAALMSLALTYPETPPWFRRSMVPVVYAPLVGWAYLIFGTSHLIAGETSGPFGPSAVVGDLYLPLASAYAAWFYLSVALFVQNWRRVRGSPLRRMQGVVVLGLLLGSLPAGVTEIFWPLLNGYDTRLGLGSVYTLVWSVFLAFAIARYRYLSIEPVTEPPSAAHARHPLSRGLNYLVVEPGRSAGMSAFRDIVSTTPGLCVTGLAPPWVAQRFGLERTPILWITRVSTEDRTVRAEALDFELLHTVLKFLRENPGTAVLLDDLDYLVAMDGFEAVARFVKRVSNQASASSGTLIVSAGRGTLTAEQQSFVGGMVDHVLEVREPPDGTVRAGHGNVVILRPPQDVAVVLASLPPSRGLVVTTDHPSKVRRRLGSEFEVLWVTDHPETGFSCARSTALDTEARKAVSGFLARGEGASVVFPGIEQLALMAGFPATLAFLKDVSDLAALRGAWVVAMVSPGTLNSREVAMMARRLDVPVGAALTGSLLGGQTTAAPGSRTPTRGPVS